MLAMTHPFSFGSSRSVLACHITRRALLRTCGCVALIGPVLTACRQAPARSAPTPPATVSAAFQDHTLSLVYRESVFSAFALDSHRQAARDVVEAIEADRRRICADLQSACEFEVVVRLYPDQASFDRSVPHMKGYYACSGDGVIHMVSPVNPSPQRDIAYEDRVRIAVHEYVHLVNNTINLNMPLWLNEGVSVYVGPHEVYEWVCLNRFPLDRVPAFRDLVTAYGEVPAADLFAYAAVDYLVAEYGLDSLNALLRSPETFESILGVSRTEFERGWRAYMSQHYRSSDHA